MIENNKLIAEFMGGTYVNSPYLDKSDNETKDFWHWTKPEYGYPICAITGVEWSTAFMIGNFKYHTSWDWLMPVVEKIESLNSESGGKYIVFVHGNNCTIQDSKLDTSKPPYYYFNEYYGDTKLQATYQAVLQFIQWFNTQKQSV